MFEVFTQPLCKKPWGRTRCVFRDATHEVWHATIGTGGFSSRHKHVHKVNRFYLVSGVLSVHVYHNELAAVPKYTWVVSAGEAIDIPDGAWHQFEAAAGPVELVEVYWAGLKGEDIVRLDEGGVKV